MRATGLCARHRGKLSPREGQQHTQATWDSVSPGLFLMGPCPVENSRCSSSVCGMKNE